MVLDDKIEKIYDLVNSGEELTTKKLNEIGLNSNKIKEYVDSKIIVRISRGIYMLNDLNILYTRLYEAINKDNIYEISYYFEQIYNIDNSVINKYLLYLMNDLYKLSDSLIKCTKELDLDNMRLTDDDKLSRTYNNIIYHSLCKKDNKSLYIANTYITQKRIQDEVMCLLIEKRWKKMRYQISTINLLVRQKKYNEVIAFLNSINELNRLEQNILEVCKKYIEISNTKKIPSIKNIEISNLTEAIEANDFKKAHRLCVDYNNKNFILKENSAILIILEDILKLISKINSIGYNEVLENIKNNNDNLFEIVSIIDKYLDSIGKSKYSSIVLDNLKLDLLNNDNKYTFFRKICNGLENDNYVYYLDYYVKQFYIELGHNNMNKASTYLDIIYNGIELGYECPIINLLEDTINYTKKFFSREKIEFESNKEYYLENKNNLNEKSDIDNADNNEIISNEDIKYINAKFDKVRDSKRFIHIKKINEERKKLLKIMVINSLDISYLDTTKSLTLWYTPYKNKRVNTRDLKIKGEQLYRNNNLKEALSVFQELVEHGQFSSYTMARLGLICLNLNYINWSIEYLTFATELSEKFNNDFDFTALLSKLTKKDNEINEVKYKVEFNYSEFTNDNNYDDIDNIDEISTMVSKGNSIKEVCESFNMNDEQICLVYLFYVREYYMNGDYEIGDKILKYVEQSQNKTEKVISLMNDIRKNKKFYLYRENNEFRLIKKIKAIAFIFFYILVHYLVYL